MTITKIAISFTLFLDIKSGFMLHSSLMPFLFLSMSSIYLKFSFSAMSKAVWPNSDSSLVSAPFINNATFDEQSFHNSTGARQHGEVQRRIALIILFIFIIKILMSHWKERMNETKRSWPKKQAQCSGVEPLLLTQLTSSPYFARYTKQFIWFSWAAMWIRECPSTPVRIYMLALCDCSVFISSWALFTYDVALSTRYVQWRVAVLFLSVDQPW